MRFALLGDHPDGLDMARALVQLGGHQLVVYSGPAAGRERLSRWNLEAPQVGDLEEVLADPAVSALIVASAPGLRPAQLRRAVQSERHVLCVHPADAKPDLAYEAALLRQDSGKVLLPLLPEALHPAFQRFRAVIAAAQGCRLLVVDRRLEGTVQTDETESSAGLRGWDVLRLLGGEVAEVTGLTAAEEVAPDKPLLLAGRFLDGTLFQATLLPKQSETRESYTFFHEAGQASLEFETGWPGPARLRYRDAAGADQVETWTGQNPWAALVERWQETLRDNAAAKRGPVAPARTTSLTQGGALSWQDEIRAVELDDAVRRSVARRRTSLLDHQEVSEEATFKGAMTLLGCSLLWMTLALLILSVWAPWLGWFIPVVVGLFLLLQFLGWVVAPAPGAPGAGAPAAGASVAMPLQRDSGGGKVPE